MHWRGLLLGDYPTKEALIQGVVSHLMEELKKTGPGPGDAPGTALQELRLEFDDLRKLLRAKPKLYRFR